MIAHCIFSLITGCCYKFLENPASVKNGTTKDLIFNLLGVLVKKYNYGLGGYIVLHCCGSYYSGLVLIVFCTTCPWCFCWCACKTYAHRPAYITYCKLDLFQMAGE